jgi:large subunit ribosomal protein L18
VQRSNKFIYVQVINDETGVTLASANELMLTKAKVKVQGTKIERASLVAQAVAQQLKDQKISKLCFDRGAYRYHGRVKAVAEAIRQAGLEM